jgi:hypothetical protein
VRLFKLSCAKAVALPIWFGTGMLHSPFIAGQGRNSKDDLILTWVIPAAPPSLPGTRTGRNRGLGETEIFCTPAWRLGRLVRFSWVSLALYKRETTFANGKKLAFECDEYAAFGSMISTEHHWENRTWSFDSTTRVGRSARPAISNNLLHSKSVKLQEMNGSARHISQISS